MMPAMFESRSQDRNATDRISMNAAADANPVDRPMGASSVWMPVVLLPLALIALAVCLQTLSIEIMGHMPS